MPNSAPVSNTFALHCFPAIAPATLAPSAACVIESISCSAYRYQMLWFEGIALFELCQTSVIGAIIEIGLMIEFLLNGFEPFKVNLYGAYLKQGIGA